MGMQNTVCGSSPGIFEDIDFHRIKINPKLLHRSLSQEPTNNNTEIQSIELQDLMQSIERVGLLHPIVVRARDGCFELVSGNRRLAACRNLGWRKILCHVVELSEQEAYETSLIENIQRQTLEPIEEAAAFKKYIIDFGWGGLTHLADKIGKSTSFIEKRLRILELPTEVQNRISEGIINPSIGAELTLLRNSQVQSELGRLIQEKKLSSRKVRQIVKHYNVSEYREEDSCNVYPKIGTDEYYESTGIRKMRMGIIDKKAQRSFEKAILVMRVASNKLVDIIENSEENWIVYEVLMQHKHSLNKQIDLLIKEKMKI